MTQHVTLIDGEKRQDEHPETFVIPPLWVRHSVDAGDVVKVGFELQGTGAERMWVRVTRVTDNGTYEGELDNHPAILPMDYGDAVAFGPENILDVWS